jgi:ADP-ribose pyrophosphatase YjhB (NUDIX family)
VKKMKTATLCFIIQENKILLGMKKRGFGRGKWNGFGGKVIDGESVEDAAKRELLEESGINATNLEEVGKLKFIFQNNKEWNQIVHAFLVKEWMGYPKETEEMLPRWFNIKELPFDKMWNDDKFWLPKIIDGKKIYARFVFKEDGETILEMSIDEH